MLWLSESANPTEMPAAVRGRAAVALGVRPEARGAGAAVHGTRAVAHGACADSAAGDARWAAGVPAYP